MYSNRAPAYVEQTPNNDKPTRAIVGATVIGPIKRKRIPTNPVKPMKI